MPARKDRVAAKATTVKFGSVEVPVLAPSREDAAYVPAVEDYADPLGYLETYATAYMEGDDVLLVGDTGVGKTSLLRHFCARVNMPYRRFPCHEATDISSLVGRKVLGGDPKNPMPFQKGIVYEATERGHMFVGDEYNMAHADVRVALNPLHKTDEGVLIVAENEGEVIPRHPEFRLAATINPYEYAGTKEIGAQIMRRFGVVLQMEYLPFDAEHDLLMDAVPELRGDVARQMVNAANAVRLAKEDERLGFPMSYDDIRHWARYSLKFGAERAAEITVLNKITDKLERSAVTELLSAHFGDWTVR